MIVVFCFISCFSVICFDLSVSDNKNLETELGNFQDAVSMSQEKELTRYYLKNNIRPMSKEYEASGKRILSRAGILNHLIELDSSCQWNSTPSVEKDLANKYGVNPINTYESMKYIMDAKNGIEDWPSTKESIGCGTIAMIECLNYLAETLQYNSLNKFTSNKVTNVNDILMLNRTNRAYNVLAETKSTGWWDEGTSIMPSSFVSGANAVLNKYDLRRASNDCLINVTGDLVSNTKNKQGRIDEIKQYIDNGVIFVMWTGAEFGEFSTHYVNIIGYEDWQGVDANGNIITKTFIKLNFNWSSTTTIYMDSELLSRPTMGLIRFELKYKNMNLDQSYMGIDGSYNSSLISKDIPNADGMYTTISYKRVAYVKHYSDAENTAVDGRYIVLSPNKKGEGEAMLDCFLPMFIKEIHIDISWWRIKDRYTSNKGELKLQIYNINTESWVTIYDFLDNFSLLSYDLDAPTRYQFKINYRTLNFRIYAKYDNPTSTRNNGRVVLHGINVFG